MRVLGDRLVVKPNSFEQPSSGLIIPEAAQERQSEGKVLEVGPEVEGIEQGEQIVFSTYGGVELEFDGEKVLVLRQSDVLIVLDGDG